jgi:hypothetical protein
MKKVLISLLAVSVAAAGIYFFAFRKTEKVFNSAVNPAFGQYITSYTAGVIGSGSPVRVVLSHDVAEETAVGSETTLKLFDLTPAVKGTTIWVDKRTLEFKPAARLVSGQIYKINFNLHRLMEVPVDLKTFEYSLQVIPQNFEVSIDNVKPYVKTDLKRQKIEGMVYTADFAEGELVEKMIAATQDGTSLKVNWTHTGEGKTHSFVVEDVARKDAASKVTLAFAGASLNVEHQEEREVEIPALGDFKVVNVRVEQGTSQQVIVQFSDPLNETQNLEGLIRISQLNSLDFEVKDNEVKVFPPVRQTGSRTITIEAGVKNILNYKMSDAATFDVAFEQTLPAVRFAGKGSILPSTDGLVMPFEAVNLKSVDVKVIKIYEDNVLQFLQVNDFDGSQELRRVGRPILSKTISLENAGVADLGKWNRFTLDLSTLIQAEPGAIYQVRISFQKILPGLYMRRW